jgi:hypothetical protein
MTLPRKTRIKPVRSALRRGELSKAEKTSVRRQVYERAGGLCEVKLHSKCIRVVLDWDGDTPWNHGHLVHRKSKGSGGKWTLDNLLWGCPNCHLISLHNPKPVPSKTA